MHHMSYPTGHVSGQFCQRGSQQAAWDAEPSETRAVLETSRNTGAPRDCSPSSQGVRPLVLWEAEWSVIPPLGEVESLGQWACGPGSPGSLTPSNTHSGNTLSD